MRLRNTTLFTLAFTAISLAELPAQYEMLGGNRTAYTGNSNYTPNPSFQSAENPATSAHYQQGYGYQQGNASAVTNNPSLQQAGETINYTIANISQGVGMFFDSVFGRRSYHPSTYPQSFPQADPRRGQGQVFNQAAQPTANPQNAQNIAPTGASYQSAPMMSNSSSQEVPADPFYQATESLQPTTPSYSAPAPQPQQQSYSPPSPIKRKTTPAVQDTPTKKNNNIPLYNPLNKGVTKKSAAKSKPPVKKKNPALVKKRTPEITESPAEEDMQPAIDSMADSNEIASVEENSYPFGSIGSEPGRVKSPYPPYNELDITGLDSGQLAIDPTTDQIFRVP